jgi:uncharacterized protein YgiM (DUF1202 family)
MSELTPDERRKIYEEERVRLAARKKLERKKTRPTTWGCLIIIIIIACAILIDRFSTSPNSRKQSASPPGKETKIKPVSQPLYIAYKSVNVRSDPSASSEIIDQLKKYETIRGDSENGWIKCVKSGKVGYISKSVLNEAGYPMHVKINKFELGEYGFFEVVGEVINTSNDTYQFVELEAIYLDKD